MYTALTTLLLPTLLLAAPSPLSIRQNQACTPSSYSISSFSITNGANPGPDHIHFGFTSSFTNPAIIVDAASSGATCDSASNPDGSFPNSNECSTGRANLGFDLAGPANSAKYQIFHTWKCNGQTWMSSTPVQITGLSCSGTTCTSPGKVVAPQNVRQICSTPTCP